MTRQIPPTPRSEAINNNVATRDPQDALSSTLACEPALREMRELTKGRASVGGDAFVRFVERFGYSFLTDQALEAVDRVTRPHGSRILSAFTGLGYAEAQMVAAGMNVIGFDRVVKPVRWLLDTHEVIDSIPFKRFGDRALFMSFPEISKGPTSSTTEIVNNYLAEGGSTVILISEARPTAHAIKTDVALLQRLRGGECIEEVALPKWPAVTAFTGYGHVHSTFEPVLRAYRFR